MIFNPFDIQSFHNTWQPAAPIPWAPLQLQDNIPLVLLVLLFVIANLLAWHPKGVMRHQLAWLGNTRNARTFEASAVIYPWLQPLLLIQFFLFFGLCLLYISDDQMAEHFVYPTDSFLIQMAICLIIPIGWYLIQFLLINWFCYLFNIHNRQVISNRCYQATHIILSPASTLIFIFLMAGSFSAQTAAFLLAALFILSQIVLIFNGFKIFCINLYSFLLFFVYLCTLEIAPLAVIYTKLMG